MQRPELRSDLSLTLGQRAADGITAAIGSWRFIIIQSGLLVLWLALNGYLLWAFWQRDPIDPFPFILLNLMLSFQAAYTGPVVMMSQNRQAQRDRALLEAMYHLMQESDILIKTEDAELKAVLQEIGEHHDHHSPDESGTPFKGTTDAK